MRTARTLVGNLFEIWVSAAPWIVLYTDTSGWPRLLIFTLWAAVGMCVIGAVHSLLGVFR